MKKFLSLIVIAVAVLFAAPQANAYSEEMQEFAKLLNQEASDGTSAYYDGTNIIISFPSSFFDEEEQALFANVDDMQQFAPLMVEVLKESMGADTLNLFGQLLSLYDTNLVIRMNLGPYKKEIMLTPELMLE